MSLKGLPGIFKTLVICTVLAGLLGTGWVLYQRFSGSHSINTYRDCVEEGGNAVLMSYPAVCITKHGKRFEDPANKVYQPPYEGGVPASRN